MLDRLDASLSATAGPATVLLAGWLLLSVLTAVGLRASAGLAGGRTRPALTSALDGALRLLVPGLAGRALRTAVGLGAAGSAVLAGVAVPLSDAIAWAAAPTFAPALLSAAPAADPVPVSHPATPPPVAAGPRQPANDLWPLSPHPPTSPHEPLPHHQPRTPQGQPSPPASRGRGENPAQPRVVVLRGDTLWAIAVRHLPAGASNASIDAAWRRWFDVNRAVIGPDPDLLLPGQILATPGPVGVPG